MSGAEHLAFVGRDKGIKYDRAAICRELEATAEGLAYCGSALYVARDLPELDDADREELSLWLDGGPNGPDHAGRWKRSGSHRLQEVALKIRNYMDSTQEVQ